MYTVPWTKFSALLFHTISQNALANATRTVLQVVLAMGGTYFIVRIISPQQYGIWALATTFASFTSWVDLGISTALMRFTAYDGRHKAAYFWTCVWFYSLAGLGAIGILWLIQRFAAAYFFREHLPSIWFLVFTLLGSWLALISTTLTTYLNGLQRMKRSNLIEMSKSILFYGVVLFCLDSLGIIALPLGLLLSVSISMPLGWLVIPVSERPSFQWADRTAFKKLVRFGINSYLIALISQTKLSFLRLLTSWAFAIEYVTYLDMALKIVTYLRNFLASLSIPLLPAASLWQQRHQVAKVVRAHQLALALLAILSLVSCLGVAVSAQWIVMIWLGPAYAPTIPLVRWAALAVWFNILLAPAFAIFQGLNRFHPLLTTAACGLFGYLLLPLIGRTWMGPVGIMVGYAVAEGAVSLGFFIWLKAKQQWS